MPDTQSTPTDDKPSSHGWYPNPDMNGEEKYWDGTWTNRTRAADPEVETYNQDLSIITWGFATAFLVPIVGFILGIITCARGRRIGMGVAIMVTAIVMTGVWFAIYVEVALNQAEDEIEQILNESPSDSTLDEDPYAEDYLDEPGY